MTYKNLTGHKVVHEGIEYAPAGYEVRIPYKVRNIRGEWTSVMKPNQIDLPPKQSDVRYIVSSIVAILRQDRDDLVIPVGINKDAQGNKIGAQNLVVVRIEK